MIRKTKTAKSLVGLFCLPTSSKFHLFELERSPAADAGQEAFLLGATQSLEDGGYPAFVVLTAPEGALNLSLNEEVDTQHAIVRKNLPSRRVVAIRRADGTFEGDLSAAPRGLGHPHWAFIPTTAEGSADPAVLVAVENHLEKKRAAAKEAASALAALKKTKKA